MFKNLKIGIRLGIGFAVTLLLLIVVSAVGVTRVGDDGLFMAGSHVAHD